MAGKKKYTKIGTVLLGQYGEFITLGDEKNNNANFKYNVEIRVTDNEGKKLFQGKNVRISMLDPRNKPGLTEEKREKIPKAISSELFIISDAE